MSGKRSSNTLSILLTISWLVRSCLSRMILRYLLTVFLLQLYLSASCRLVIFGLSVISIRKVFIHSSFCIGLTSFAHCGDKVIWFTLLFVAVPCFHIHAAVSALWKVCAFYDAFGVGATVNLNTVTHVFQILYFSDSIISFCSKKQRNLNSNSQVDSSGQFMQEKSLPFFTSKFLGQIFGFTTSSCFSFICFSDPTMRMVCYGSSESSSFLHLINYRDNFK